MHCANPTPLPAAARTRPPRSRLALCLLTLPWWLGACTSLQPPQPWEKGELARPVMTMDRDPLEARAAAHVYFSKEASSGGEGVGGGGCGCN